MFRLENTAQLKKKRKEKRNCSNIYSDASLFHHTGLNGIVYEQEPTRGQKPAEKILVNLDLLSHSSFRQENNSSHISCDHKHIFKRFMLHIHVFYCVWLKIQTTTHTRVHTHAHIHRQTPKTPSSMFFWHKSYFDTKDNYINLKT